MIVNVFCLVRVHGTSKFAPVGIKKLEVRSAAKAAKFIEQYSADPFLFQFNKRYNAAEYLHMLTPVLRLGDTTDSGQTDTADDAQTIVKTAFSLCGTIRERLDLENKDLYFMFIALKGSKEE